jgi:hypothetical protein
MPLSTEEFIRDAAARNWSRQQTCQALEISASKFRAICDALPDVIWPAVGRSEGHLRDYATRKGIDPEHLQRSRDKAIQSARDKHSYEVFGRRGTINQLAHLSPVPAGTIRRRISRGMPPVEAFTNPPMSCADRPRKRQAQ